MMITLRIAIVLVGLILVSGCESSSTAPEPLSDTVAESELRAHVWQWVGYVTGEGVYMTDTHENHHFVMVADTMEGVSDCNAFWAECKLTGSTIHTEWIISRLLGCEGIPSFARDLAGTSSYTITGSQLVIRPSAGCKQLLVFRARG